MKIAVASEGEDFKSQVSPRGGRAPYYLLFEDGKLVETMKNPFAMGGGGAGWSIAHVMAEKGVELVIAGEIGPNMKVALEQKGIKSKEISRMTVRELIEKLNK